MRGARVVVFDLGGVLVRICRTWEEACARASVPVRDMGRFREGNEAARRKELTHLHQTGAIACGEFFGAIASASGGQYSADEVRRVHEAWLIGDYAGVEALVEGLARAGTRTACLSNTNHAHWEVLSAGPGRSRAVERLGTHLVSHRMRAAKPHEDIYRLAEESLGASPAQIVFFDDLEENVEAARRRGWRAHLIDHAGDPAAQIDRRLACEAVGQYE